MSTTRRRFLANAATTAAAAALACTAAPARARHVERFRVICSANPMPVHNDPAGDRVMLQEYGFEPWALCDHGTLNRLAVFVADDGSYLRNLDWRRAEARRDDPDHPQHEWAVRNWARLCRDGANRFKTHLPATLPMYFNLEIEKWSLDVWHGPDPERKADAIMANWLKIVRWAKEATGGACPVSAYMLPQAYRSETAQQLARELSYALPSLYMIDEYVGNPNLWFDAVDRVAAQYAEHYPWLPKVAVINPTWQVYRDPAQQAKWNGKPVSLELWTRQLKHLADRKWNGALCWWGLTRYDPTIRPYLRELDQMQR